LGLEKLVMDGGPDASEYQSYLLKSIPTMSVSNTSWFADIYSFKAWRANTFLQNGTSDSLLFEILPFLAGKARSIHFIAFLHVLSLMCSPRKETTVIPFVRRSKFES
jgi:hypothetical protein